MASQRRLAAIMFTDLAGFTSRTHENEAGALQLLREQESDVQPALAAHSGRQVKTIGDGRLIEFPNALDAVECAVDLQRRLHDLDSSKGGSGLPTRVGSISGTSRASEPTSWETQ